MTVSRAALLAVVVGFAVPATAVAGGLSRTVSAITVTGNAAGESVDFVSDGGMHVVKTNLTWTTSNGCTLDSPEQVTCSPVASLIANMAGGDDTVDGRQITDAAKLTANGGAGADTLDGTLNADTLNGQDGDDLLVGEAGNDALDGGVGNDYLQDGPGNDTLVGGPGDDTMVAGLGADTFAGGDGTDTADYSGRSAPVTLTLNDGVANDGEAGEGDNLGADVESASGGAGNDVIRGSDGGGYLYGNGGNDTITAGKGEDRVEGHEGDDIIDTRDGRYDSIDCGPGTDTLLADPGDGATNCEIAPDPDGDGYLAPADCAPDNPAINPGAGEIVGNDVDEDCKDGPLYLRVVAPISYGTKVRGAKVQFAKLTISEIRAGDKLSITCKGGKKKGCAFASKKLTIKSGQKRVDIAKLLKKKYLAKGVVLEIRLTRTNEIGRVQRYTVQAKGKIKPELLCLKVGQTKPSRCA